MSKDNFMADKVFIERISSARLSNHASLVRPRKRQHI